MRSAIFLTDTKEGTVSMTTELDEITALENKAPPSPSSIMMLGAMCLFETGDFAQAGAVALKALEEDRSPIDAVKEFYARVHADA